MFARCPKGFWPDVRSFTPMKLRALIARIAVLCMLPVMAWAMATPRACWMWRSRSNKVLEQARDLVALIERAARLDEPARLAAVNQFFNQRIAFHDDAETWGVPDYWASPLESLERRAGDCEDHAIAGHFALAASGVPVSRLRMVYVRARLAGQSQAHMVLAYYAEPNAEPEILDNLRPEVLPVSRRPDLDAGVQFQYRWPVAGVGAQSQGDPLARPLAGVTSSPKCVPRDCLMEKRSCPDATGDLAGAGRGTGGAVGCAGVRPERAPCAKPAQLRTRTTRRRWRWPLSQQGGDEALIKLLVSASSTPAPTSACAGWAPMAGCASSAGEGAREPCAGLVPAARAHQRGRWRGPGLERLAGSRCRRGAAQPPGLCE